MRGYFKIKPSKTFRSENIKVYAFELKSKDVCALK